MIVNSATKNLEEVIQDFNFNGEKKFKLIILFGLLGDFDSLEYAINLKTLKERNQLDDLDIYGIAIGNKNGKEKFCDFTGFPKENLEVVSNNIIHTNLMASKGIDIGFGGWINMLLMLSGINSFKTIKEVLRGYTGDRSSKQIFSDSDQINILNLIKFSGVSFKNVFGEGYLRPFELATFRLNNMMEIMQNWDNYILNNKYLPQRGASFILNRKNEIIYKYFSNAVLGYSSNMQDPLGFLSEICE